MTQTDAPPHPFLSSVAPHCPQRLLDLARGLPVPRVALVNAGGAHPLRGLREAVEEGLAEPMLVGDIARIEATAHEIGWDIRGIPLFHAPGAAAAPRAAALAREGAAQAIMKGQVHTATFLKGLLPRAAGLREDGVRCGHVFHVTTPQSDRPLLITDAALNVAPDIETRQACLAHAVALALRLGIARPKAGVLAASEDAVPSVPDTIEAEVIAKWAAVNLPQAVVQGPMALDLILSREAARAKGFASEVAGDADIILTPGITTGNALFKLMVLGMGCCAGGLVMGCKVPLLLTSRAQKAPDRIASAALGVIVAAGPP